MMPTFPLCKQDDSYSVNQSGRSILLMEYEQGSHEKPTDLVFPPDYGTIEKHLWFGDGYILVAFRWVEWSLIQ